MVMVDFQAFKKVEDIKKHNTLNRKSALNKMNQNLCLSRKQTAH